MLITITKEQKDYIAKQLKSGQFRNASEVISDALRLHEFNQKTIEELLADITIGSNRPYSKKSIQDILKEKQSVTL